MPGQGLPPHVLDDPDGLTPRASTFLKKRAERRTVVAPAALRERLADPSSRSPAGLADHAAHFQARYGGLVLPVVRMQDEALSVFDVGDVHPHDDLGYHFEAGHSDGISVAAFLDVDPKNRLGMVFPEKSVVFTVSVTGWIEAVALADHVRQATERGDFSSTGTFSLDRDQLPELANTLSGLRQVPEVAGMADDWLAGDGTLVEVLGGEIAALTDTNDVHVTVYIETDGKLRRTENLLKEFIAQRAGHH